MAKRDPGPQERQANWWNSTPSYEIYYPKKFSPIYPWEEHMIPPKYPWNKEAFPVDLFPDHLRMNYEIVNPQQRRHLIKLLSGEGRTLAIPITHLSHWTHKMSADSIENEDGAFVFKTRQKKSRENSYRYSIDDQSITAPELVLPGYLTWWGINVINWYENNGRNVQKIEVALRKKRNDRVYLPHYLQYIDGCGSSVYGSHSFTSSLSKLIESYETSRKDCTTENEGKVYFKKAGTLRYRHEICYVVLVCMGKDLKEDEIQSMEGAGKHDEVDGNQVTYFESKEFIADDGEVLNRGLTPNFISEYPVKAIYSDSKSGGRYYSWDTLSFAFYYPNIHGELRIQGQNLQREFDAEHVSSSCHLGVCPDNQ